MPGQGMMRLDAMRDGYVERKKERKMREDAVFTIDGCVVFLL